MFDLVFTFEHGTADTFTAAVLGAVAINFGALDVAGPGDGDDDFFFGDEVFDRHVAIVAVEDFENAAIVRDKIRKLEKEGNEISKYIKSISFFPYYQTASNDIASQERRAQAMRNGVQELINILSQECNNQKEKLDNTRFWISTIIAIISLILAITPFILNWSDAN